MFSFPMSTQQGPGAHWVTFSDVGHFCPISRFIRKHFFPVRVMAGLPTTTIKAGFICVCKGGEARIDRTCYYK